MKVTSLVTALVSCTLEIALVFLKEEKLVYKSYVILSFRSNQSVEKTIES